MLQKAFVSYSGTIQTIIFFTSCGIDALSKRTNGSAHFKKVNCKNGPRGLFIFAKNDTFVNNLCLNDRYISKLTANPVPRTRD